MTTKPITFLKIQETNINYMTNYLEDKIGCNRIRKPYKSVIYIGIEIKWPSVENKM